MSLLSLTAASTMKPDSSIALESSFSSEHTFLPPSPAPEIASHSVYVGQQFEDPMFGQNLQKLPQHPFEDRRQLWYRRKSFLPHKDPPRHEMPPSLYTPWTLPPQEVYAPRITYSPSITPMHVEQYPYLPGPLMPIQHVPTLPKADPSTEDDLNFARVQPVEHTMRSFT